MSTAPQYNLTLKNLTPHKVTLSGVTLPACDTPPRVAVARELIGLTAEGVGIYVSRYGEPQGLPDEEAGVLLVVSRVLRDACTDRLDLVCPGTLVRGPDGQPTGADGVEALRFLPRPCTCGSGGVSPGVHGGCNAGSEFCG